MAYESPISIVERIARSATEEMEDSIVRTVSLHYGVTVNKEELKKALLYDRQQYEKGYADAESIYKNKWIPVSEKLPEEYGEYICTMSDGDVRECGFIPSGIKELIAGWSTCEADGHKRLDYQDIIAWQPLPKPYKAESEE